MGGTGKDCSWKSFWKKTDKFTDVDGLSTVPVTVIIFDEWRIIISRLLHLLRFLLAHGFATFPCAYSLSCHAPAWRHARFLAELQWHVPFCRFRRSQSSCLNRSLNVHEVVEIEVDKWYSGNVVEAGKCGCSCTSWRCNRHGRKYLRKWFPHPRWRLLTQPFSNSV